jgi:hypothetical protein
MQDDDDFRLHDTPDHPCYYGKRILQFRADQRRDDNMLLFVTAMRRHSQHPLPDEVMQTIDQTARAPVYGLFNHGAYPHYEVLTMPEPLFEIPSTELVLWDERLYVKPFIHPPFYSNWWMTLRLNATGMTLYDNYIAGRVMQYVSPAALGSGARLVLKISSIHGFGFGPNVDVTRLDAQGHTCWTHGDTTAPDRPFTDALLGDSQELSLTLTYRPTDTRPEQYLKAPRPENLSARAALLYRD